MFIDATIRKPGVENPMTCALSVRLHKEDMDFLKQSAESNCRTLADEVRFLIRTARKQQAPSPA